MNEPKLADDSELEGDGSIVDPMQEAEDALNPMPASPDDPETERQQKRVEDQNKLS